MAGVWDGGVVSALLNFERFVQGLVEGSIFRLLRSRVEPVEIAKRLGYAMEGEQRVGVGRTIVPNRYTVLLNEEDYAGLEPIAESIQQELEVYLGDLARERGFVFLAPPYVELRAAAGLPARAIQIETALADSSRSSQSTPLRSVPRHTPPAAERTQIFRPIGPRPPSGSLSGPCLVRIDPAGAGWRHRLGELTRIGRGFDNDLILEERTVSRHHAEIRQLPDGTFEVIDLESTNGVVVNGERVREHVLQPGDRIRLGTIEFAFDPNPV